MILNGYTVDGNISAFRQHFHLPDLLAAMNARIPFQKWIVGMCSAGHLDDGILKSLCEIREAWYGLIGKKNLEKVLVLSEADEGYYRILKWFEKEVEISRISECKLQCFLIGRLIDIAGYQLGDSDWESLRAYLKQQGLLETAKLRIIVREEQPSLCLNGRVIAILPPVALEVRQRYADAITSSGTTYSGYLAVAEDGRLLNASRFFVPDLSARPVKALANEMNYAILLENGSVIHNLRFSPLPEEPVMDITLSGDVLRWRSMKEEQNGNLISR